MRRNIITQMNNTSYKELPKLNVKFFLIFSSKKLSEFDFVIQKYLEFQNLF